MADALDSKSGFSDEVWVQVPSPVPIRLCAPVDLFTGFFCVFSTLSFEDCTGE